ncbi:MAG: TIGR00730 family Rossman fold protein [Alphaproteobacteria bacterium]|nr:TIGR00730 family Rossman fold protein [Alphaproteobacteria bacterium]
MANASHHSNVKSICVFCGSSPGRNPVYLAAARRAGELIGQRGFRMVYGGGASGMMGEAARAALAAGAGVIGVRPAPLDHLELPQGGIEMIQTPDLFERKQRMVAMSDVFLILPGGLGTLDEFFEVATTAQLGMHEKIIILVNTDGYFEPLLALFQRCKGEGFVYGDLTRLFYTVETPDAAFALL